LATVERHRMRGERGLALGEETSYQHSLVVLHIGILGREEEGVVSLFIRELTIVENANEPEVGQGGRGKKDVIQYAGKKVSTFVLRAIDKKKKKGPGEGKKGRSRLLRVTGQRRSSMLETDEGSKKRLGRGG